MGFGALDEGLSDATKRCFAMSANLNYLLSIDICSKYDRNNKYTDSANLVHLCYSSFVVLMYVSACWCIEADPLRLHLSFGASKNRGPVLVIVDLPVDLALVY